ncbi:Lrp/AsnC family transcriptional regulator [Hahella ganghwensis]|uniref:Lrp/AsnC family transcriptional regulator n=1 Tax=Hahella ganghwensis TaxID=286420 RepID=UPI0003699974|nr:Lrp/AsnC family transcriptional regulator [Hahella ganghwensis]
MQTMTSNSGNKQNACRAPDVQPSLDELDRQIINHLQKGLPVCDTPYAKAAEALNITETTLLERLNTLINTGYLTRFGPMYHAERLGGALTLAAMKVPPSAVATVADIINSHPEVAHNYERDHEFNLWFVIATEHPHQIEEVTTAIATESGYPVFNLPKQREFYVGLYFHA